MGARPTIGRTVLVVKMLLGGNTGNEKGSVGARLQRASSRWSAAAIGIDALGCDHKPNQADVLF